MSSGEVIGNIAVIVVLALIVFVVISLVRAVRIVPQSQAYVVERLGRFQAVMQGGFHLLGQGLSADPGAVRHGIKPQHLSGTVHNTAPLAKFRSGWPAWSAARPNAAG